MSVTRQHHLVYIQHLQLAEGRGLVPARVSCRRRWLHRLIVQKGLSGTSHRPDEEGERSRSLLAFAIRQKASKETKIKFIISPNAHISLL